MALTVRDVLALPVVQAGRPELLAGADALDRAVRWVHVSELADIALLLRGGELILTTGVALPERDAGLREFVATLSEAGASGLVVELGRRFSDVPRAVVDAARAAGLPVVALHRTVRFVAVTETVHALILDEQYALLRTSERAHQEFTRLSVEGASVQRILDKVAEMSGVAVVLEDLAHRAVAFAPGPGAAAELLDRWEARSRVARFLDGTGVVGPEGWLVTPVGPRQQRWGRLVAPDARHAAQATVTMLLERAAEALAINRLVERDRAGLVHQAHRGLLTDLVAGRVTDEAELRSRADALGLPTGRQTYVGVAVQVRTPPGADPVAAEALDRGLVEAVTDAAAEARLTALVATLRPGQALALLAVSPGRAPDRAVRQLAQRAGARLDAVAGERGHAIGVGPEAGTLATAAGSLAEAAHVAQVGLALAGTRPRAYYRSADLRLHGLLTALREDPRVQSFAEAELGRLLDHDARHGSDLVGTLRAYFTAGGNKTRLARSTHLSRPALYARLATVEQVLGASLDDPDSTVALHVALLVRDLAGSPLTPASLTPSPAAMRVAPSRRDTARMRTRGSETP